MCLVCAYQGNDKGFTVQIMTYDPQIAKGIIQIAETGQSASGADSAIGMLMNLRKTANHPLLVSYII